MLSRVADCLFWMARYLERAENIARFIHVTQSISLGDAHKPDGQWSSLIFANGETEQYEELYRTYSRRNVLEFLTFNRDNPNSIISSLIKARENARTIREVISVAMWESINRFYLRVREAERHADEVLKNPSQFLDRVKRSSHQLIGAMEATMSHGEAWNFATMGRLLERADMTSRILDVKYYILLPKSSQVGSTYDIVQWSALLESSSALLMYRKVHGRIEPKKVAEFLMLDRHFPRSVRYCVATMEECLHSIIQDSQHVMAHQPVSEQQDPEYLIAELNQQLKNSVIEEIINQGLHEFIDSFQTKINDIGQAIYHSYFELSPIPEQIQSQTTHEGSTQTQSQSQT